MTDTGWTGRLFGVEELSSGINGDGPYGLSVVARGMAQFVAGVDATRNSVKMGGDGFAMNPSSGWAIVRKQSELRAYPAPMAWSSDGLRGEPLFLDVLEQIVFFEYLLLAGLVLTVLRNNFLHFKTSNSGSRRCPGLSSHSVTPLRALPWSVVLGLCSQCPLVRAGDLGSPTMQVVSPALTSWNLMRTACAPVSVDNCVGLIGAIVIVGALQVRWPAELKVPILRRMVASVMRADFGASLVPDSAPEDGLEGAGGTVPPSRQSNSAEGGSDSLRNSLPAAGSGNGRGGHIEGEDGDGEGGGDRLDGSQLTHPTPPRRARRKRQRSPEPVVRRSLRPRPAPICTVAAPAISIYEVGPGFPPSVAHELECAVQRLQTDPDVRGFCETISRQAGLYLKTAITGCGGSGYVATQLIPPDTPICFYTGMLLPEASMVPSNHQASLGKFFAHAVVIDGTPDPSVATPLGSMQMVNHSCAPNCLAHHRDFPDGLGICYLSTARTIVEGEQITFDYKGNFWVPQKARAPSRKAGYKVVFCQCGAPCCSRPWRHELIVNSLPQKAQECDAAKGLHAREVRTSGIAHAGSVLCQLDVVTSPPDIPSCVLGPTGYQRSGSGRVQGSCVGSRYAAPPVGEATLVVQATVAIAETGLQGPSTQDPIAIDVSALEFLQPWRPGTPVHYLHPRGGAYETSAGRFSSLGGARGAPPGCHVHGSRPHQ